MDGERIYLDDMAVDAVAEERRRMSPEERALFEKLNEYILQAMEEAGPNGKK